MADIQFENRFWLRILRDHMTFIISKLASKHVQEIEQAVQLKARLVQMLNAVDSITFRVTRSNKNPGEELFALVLEVRAYKIKLLGKHVDPAVKLELGLPPTFINHMLNELDEYVDILNRAMGNPSKVFHILNVHELWMVDAAGHAGAIMSELDPTEAKLKKKFKMQKKSLKLLHHKVEEFIGYVNRLNTDFPAIQALNASAISEITIFNKMLQELLQLRVSKQVLGTIAPLMINHMIREEAYYLRKLGVNVGNLPLEDIPD